MRRPTPWLLAAATVTCLAGAVVVGPARMARMPRADSARHHARALVAGGYDAVRAGARWSQTRLRDGDSPPRALWRAASMLCRRHRRAIRIGGAILALGAVADRAADERRRRVASVAGQRRPPAGCGSAFGISAARSGRIDRLKAAAAVATVWVALVMPGQYSVWGMQDFLRLPAAGLALAGGALVVPWPVMRVAAVGFGAALGALVMLRGLNLGFRMVLTRPFDVTNDWSYLRAGAETLAIYAGRATAAAAVAGAVVATAAVSALVPWASLHTARVVARRPWRALPVIAVGVAVWRRLRTARVGWPHGYYTAWLASSAMPRMARETARVIPAHLADRAAFAREIRSDPATAIPPSQRLARLGDADVIVVFLEGLGQVAFDDPRIAPTVRPALEAAEHELHAAGFSMYSAWVDSPTFGAGSWLAHSSVEAGLWVNTQRRYNHLLSTDRLTLSKAFAAAGWRTVFVVPSTDRPWPQGRPFYGYDTLYTKFNLGYRGRPYGYATMPDQYVYRAFTQRELGNGRAQPVFAQIDTLSSHYPWTPPPPLLAWDAVGDGAAFTGPAPAAGGDHRVYADAIAYAVRSFAQFVAHADPSRLVVLAMGDHQPNHTVTRRDAGHRTPIMLIGSDDAVSPVAAAWGWPRGLTPTPDAPAWLMSDIRDRFFDAFGTRSSSAATGPRHRNPDTTE